jgi:hypothetical protein
MTCWRSRLSERLEARSGVATSATLPSAATPSPCPPKAGNTLYIVYGKIQDSGKRLTLDYTFIEQQDGRLHKVTGTATLQKE